MSPKPSVSLFIISIVLLHLLLTAHLIPTFAQGNSTAPAQPPLGASTTVTSSLPITSSTAPQLPLYLPLVIDQRADHAQVQVATEITSVLTTTTQQPVYLPLIQQGIGTNAETQTEVAPTEAVSESVSAAATVLDVRIAMGNDDGEENSNGSINLTSTDLDLMTDMGAQQMNRVVGLRFTGLALPRNVTIVNAYVQFQVDEATSETTTLTLRGEAVDNAAPFGLSNSTLSTKPRTMAAVTWSPAAWPTVGATGAAQRTPNLAPIIQELVNRSGWASNNALTLLITGSGQRVAKSFEGASSAAPVLHIEYEVAAVLIAAGDIAGCGIEKDAETALLLDNLPGTVAALGDNVYEDGTAQEYNNCYTPTWGRHKTRTRPTPGNHEYHAANATPYFTYFGSAAGEAGKGYYSYNLGAWHIIVLNSNCDDMGGCTRSSAQGQWLLADLAANPATCTLAYWHHPRFNSGALHGNDSHYQDFWQILYDSGADVVLNGHEHLYERFAAQQANGTADPARGLRQFTVGTGGGALSTFGTIRPNSEVRNNNTFGVLKLTLYPTRYDWQFMPISGQPFTDSGSAPCVTLSTTNQPPTVNAGADQTLSLPNQATLQGTVTDDGRPNPPATVTTTWSKVSGPGAVTFTNAKALITNVSFAAAGSYLLQLSASDGSLSAADQMVVTVSTTTLTILNTRITNGNNDGEENSSGAINLTSTDLDLMTDSGGQQLNRVVALRFTGLAVPRGATIVTAYIQFQSDELNSETTTLRLQGEAVDQALAFGVTNSALSTKPRTTASVTWSPVAWTTVGITWAAQRTPNLAPIIQELVNRPGWANGNAITVLLTGSGQRVATAFEGASSGAPLLHLEYR